MVLFIGLILACVIGYAVSSGIKLKKQHEAENATFAGEHKGWDIYISPKNRGVLALDHDAATLVIGTVTNHVHCPWSDLNGVEIEKNGQSIQQTNRGSQVMGAAVGAVLFGPLGLLLGGATGSKRQKERINELSLKVLVDNRSAPVHRITFFHAAGSGVDAKSFLLREPAKRMEHYHALLLNAVRSDHRKTFAPAQAIISDAPEQRVAKLWDLRQAGAITNEEYTAQKLAILGSGSAPLLGDGR